jgi:hypothetical protein
MDFIFPSVDAKKMVQNQNEKKTKKKREKNGYVQL